MSATKNTSKDIVIFSTLSGMVTWFNITVVCLIIGWTVFGGLALQPSVALGGVFGILIGVTSFVLQISE